MKNKLSTINKLRTYTLIGWSAIIIGIFTLNSMDEYRYADRLAEHEATASMKKDLAYRKWAAQHGGVYVPVTKKTPPNPYLSHIPNRDVTTNDGQKLTLMNPAYMLSEMMRDYSELYGTKGHITSSILMNPANKPDSWEKEILLKVEKSGEPYKSKEFIDGEEYFRYMTPMVTQKSCLKCHAFQGYKVGDIRGAVSTSIPMKEYEDYATEQVKQDSYLFFIIYVIGGAVIIFGTNKIKVEFLEKENSFEQQIYTMVNIIEKRDSYTAGHTARVTKYALMIGKEMELNDFDLELLRKASMLHDIGKIAIPDNILLKPGKLTELEFSIIKEHVSVGYDLLSSTDIFKDIAPIVRVHHERADGSGYPFGLTSKDIPLLAQILGVADAFDAMTTTRIYKGAKKVDYALQELTSLAGKHFDREIVRIARDIFYNMELEESIKQTATTKLEEERFVYFYKDPLTEAYNKAYLDYILSNNEMNGLNLRCIQSLNLHNFTKYNAENGWNAGDILLKNIVASLIATNDYVFRIYGDDFIIVNKKHNDDKTILDTISPILDNICVTATTTHSDIKAENIISLTDLERKNLN